MHITLRGLSFFCGFKDFYVRVVRRFLRVKEKTVGGGVKFHPHPTYKYPTTVITVCPGSKDPFYIVSLLYKMGYYFLDTQYVL